MSTLASPGVLRRGGERPGRRAWRLRGGGPGRPRRGDGREGRRGALPSLVGFLCKRLVTICDRSPGGSVPGIRRLRAAATVGVLAAVTFGIWSGVRPAAAWAGSAPTIGPVQISALGRPGLCWEAGGNGSAVTLEHCDAAVQGQQWSLTGNGVVMNGNGYCLEAQPGPPGPGAVHRLRRPVRRRRPGPVRPGLALPGRRAGQHRDQHRDLRRRRRPAVARDGDRHARLPPGRPALEHRVQLRHPGTRHRSPRRAAGRRQRARRAAAACSAPR